MTFYVADLGLDRLGGFTDHNAYDGAFVGLAGASWHLEFTQHTAHVPSPTLEDLLVLYMPRSSVDGLATRMKGLGHSAPEHPNPFWADAGASVFINPDGYPVVLCPDD